MPELTVERQMPYVLYRNSGRRREDIMALSIRFSSDLHISCKQKLNSCFAAQAKLR